MGRKTLWVSPIFLFFPIERTDRSFPAERKKKLFFLFFFRAGFCRIVVSFRRHMQLMLCTVSPAASASRCRMVSSFDLLTKIPVPGTSLFTCDQITLMKKQGPRNSSSRLIAEREPLFCFLFVVLRYPLPRLRYARRDGPSSGLFRHALFFPSSSSSSSSFYWNVLSFLSFFLLSLWFVLPAHSCYDSMRKTKWKRGKFHSFEK